MGSLHSSIIEYVGYFRGPSICCLQPNVKEGSECRVSSQRVVSHTSDQVKHGNRCVPNTQQLFGASRQRPDEVASVGRSLRSLSKQHDVGGVPCFRGCAHCTVACLHPAELARRSGTGNDSVSHFEISRHESRRPCSPCSPIPSLCSKLLGRCYNNAIFNDAAFTS